MEEPGGKEIDAQSRHRHEEHGSRRHLVSSAQALPLLFTSANSGLPDQHDQCEFFNGL